MKRIFTSIRLKLTVATLVPLVTAIVICWVIGASIITTRFTSQALQLVESDRNSAHEIFLADIARLSDLLRLTAQSPEVGATLIEQGGTLQIPTLYSLLRNERLSFLTVTDRYGFVRYRAGNPAVSGDARRADPLVAGALKGATVSGVAVLTPEQAARENPLLPSQMAIPVRTTPNARRYTKGQEERGLFQVAAAPILGPGGSVVGAVYGGELLNGDNRLADRITRVVFQRGTENAVRGNATIFLDDVRIATSVLDEEGKPAVGTLMSNEVYDAMTRGVEWIGRAFVYNATYFTAYEPLRDLRGTVVGALYVGMPEKPLLQLRQQINLLFAAILLLVTLIGAGLSAWLGRSLARPVRALEEGARRIAAGENLPDIVVGGRDEIASLAGEFNTMKRRLTARDEENRALNRTLEEKVAERTAQLQEAQKELARSERLAAVGMLASGVAHEINNPLAIIRGNAELIELTGTSEVQSEAGVIITQVGRINRIVRNLLDFSRKGDKRVARFPLQRLLNDILEQIGHQVPLEGYRIARNYDAPTLVLTGDEDQLRQVFTNLILNGLQAMPEGGELVVTATPAGNDRLTVAISDTGCGIPAEQLDQLFTPFFTTKSGGTGLGLAVSYGIVKDHGGVISVVSEPGKGSTFTVELPLRQPEGGNE